MNVWHGRGRALAIGMAAVALVGAACGKSSTTAAAGGAPSADSGSPAHAMAPFGAGCSSVPTSGSGSFEMMMHDPVVTAAASNRMLATLVHALKQAKLTDTLNAAPAITVFAPTNQAFTSMDHETLMMAMHDPKGELTKILTYHVVQGQLSPEQLAGSHTTLEGGTITVSGGGESFAVNGTAHVLCGDIHTSNATVYIIDGVLTPPKS